MEPAGSCLAWGLTLDPACWVGSTGWLCWARWVWVVGRVRCQRVVVVVRPRRSAVVVQVSSGQDADPVEGGVEVRGPGPAGGEPQDPAAAAVDEPAGEGEEPGADGAGDGELVVGVDAAEAGGPAGEVVGEHGAGEPGGVGEEPARGAVLEPGAFFEVADGELDGGVVAVELVDGDGGRVEVGDEGVVSPVGPQLGLGGVGEPGAAHDEPERVVGSLGRAAGR